MSPPEKVRQAVKVVKAGADDYVTHPIESEEVVLVVETIRQERFPSVGAGALAQRDERA